ncbi:hypothetical protein MMC09_003668 [Bachmanniomyces sp. S44760]|nr:hypothetical protein [Bachmanniomyces sp. S44760]
MPEGLPTLSSTSPINSSFQSESNDHPASSFHRRSRILGHYKSATSHPPLREQELQSKRDIQREIQANIREDWEWPTPASLSIAPSIARITPATQWRERDPDSSSPSPSPASPTQSNPYKFDRPESLAAIGLSSKRQRKRRLRAELKWNEGLQTFMSRRDGWTGGVSCLRPEVEDLENSPGTHGHPHLTPGRTELGDYHRISIDSNMATTTSDGSIGKSSSQNVSITKPVLHEPHSFSTNQAKDDTNDLTTLLELSPLPDPLIDPSNPIRARINPAAYPAIYSKVILQSQTPNSPINLLDITRALVGGWKEDGEWPPKGPTVLEPLAGRRRGKAGALERLGPVATGDGVGDEVDIGVMRRGVGKVKRVLGIKKDEGVGSGSGNGVILVNGHHDGYENGFGLNGNGHARHISNSSGYSKDT